MFSQIVSLSTRMFLLLIQCESNFILFQVLDYFVQICLGLKHVHDRKILHRDLKSQVCPITLLFLNG